jgi:beta-lactamase regulating signal transducer with metallopeptidase domain
MTLAWAYAFNILINSTLAFLTVAILVKFLMWALRIQQPRIQAICLCLPLFKIVADCFFYNFSRWALAHQIDPFQSEPGTRAITAMFCRPASTASFVPANTGIHFILADGKTFTVADLLTLSFDPLWIKSIVVLAMSISIGLCSFRLYQWLKSRQMLQKLLESCSPCHRIPRASIQSALNKTRIMISSRIDIPCAISQGRLIIFPEQLLDQLSTEEFEAIIVHELDHLRWRDSYLRMALQLLCAFFWWIPTKRGRSRFEQMQELACDAKISKFNISAIDLASAITKTAQTIKKHRRNLHAMCFVESTHIVCRINALLKQPKRTLGWSIAQTLLIGSLLIPIFFGQFWIF